MKFNKYIGWSLGVMALFSGCADNDFSEPRGPWDGEVPEELNIVVNVADPDLVKVGETRSDDGSISSLTVMQYDKDGQFIGMLTPAVTKVNGKYNINVKLDKAVAELQFAANHSVSSSCKDLSKEVVTAALPANANELAAWNPVLWGKVSLSELMADANRYEPSIVLYRQVAKVSVTNSASNFQFKGFGVYKTADRGTVAPTLANYTASLPTVADGVSYTGKSEKLGADGIAYVYETPKETDANTPKVIVEGEINGKTYYYVAGFRNRTGSGASDNAGSGKYEYTSLDILRNHHYAFEITSVRGEGWPTLEEAINAQPDNRLTVWVSDINDEINDMVSSRDYLLGVNNEVTVSWYAKPEITIVTSYPISNGEGKTIPEEIKITVKEDPNGMIWTAGSPELISVIEGTDRESGKAVKKVRIGINLNANENQTTSKEAKIEVRVGDLTREIKLIQEGRNLRVDLKAFIYGLTGVTDHTDYYTWVNTTCKGLQPVDNRGLERNNALIFAAVPAYGTEGIWYKIPKVLRAWNPNRVDAKIISYELDNTTDFSVDDSTDADYIIVKAKENSKPKLASGKLVLKAENGAEIDYELLQVGYFHELKSDYAKYTRGDFNAGWYYYEVTKLNGYFILDRNIGASTNNSFDPTSINYSPEDERAKGCYFVVNPGRAEFNTTDNSKRYQDLKTVVEFIGLNYDGKGKFNIPSEGEFTDMGFVQSQNRGAGAVFAEVDSESKVADNKIFIPAAGYYFGKLLKNVTHVNVWTRTLLAGTQGLMESDKEYGYQYRYLNVVGGIVSYQNLRTSAGAEGKINESLRNYLPLRLAWSEKGTVNIPVPTPSERSNFVAGDVVRFIWTNGADGIWIGDQDGNFIDGLDWTGSVTKTVVETGYKYREITLQSATSNLRYKLRAGQSGDYYQLEYSAAKTRYDEASGKFIINLNDNGTLK